MKHHFLQQAYCGDGSSRFSGRVGSIISKARPALVLTQDAVDSTAVAPEGFETGFSELKGHIRHAAAAVGKIQTRDNPPQVLATCFRVGNNKRRVATARHVSRAILQENSSVRAGLNPEIAPENLRNLRVLDVVFEGRDGLSAETHEIEGFELVHWDMDVALLRLASDSARGPIPLSAPLAGDAVRNAPVCVVGYPVTPPSAADTAIYDAMFDVGGAPQTGIKRASPGRVKFVSSPPRPELYRALHDATTLPGSSGSPVIHAETGALIGLHFQGDTGSDRNAMIYLPSAFIDVALRERFDPAIPDAALSEFIAIPTSENYAETGRALQNGVTADEMLELGKPNSEGSGSPAPAHYADAARLLSDRRDIRDRTYNPALRVPDRRYLPEPLGAKAIRKQWLLADCTGCAIGTAIDRGLIAQGRTGHVSARMLYEMGRLHDEFADDLPEGTSLRGVIKGLFHNGVSLDCDLDLEVDWFLSVDRAKEARQNTVGAYYRLWPSLPDFQMAIQEVGAVVVSAYTHSGWRAPKDGIIQRRRDRRSAHAFVLVGYDETGFLVQNSWGDDWGGWLHPDKGVRLLGVAHWDYADWADSVMDAWVLQIAPPAPAAHNLPLRAYLQSDAPQRTEMPLAIAALPKPRRLAIVGHVTHAERSGLIEADRIGVGLRSLRETALHLSTPQSWSDAKKSYSGLAFIFHDPTLGEECSARLSAALIPRFKAAGIYPMCILYGADEIRSLTARMTDEARFACALGTGGMEDNTAYLERRAGRIAEPLLGAFIDGAYDAAAESNALWSIMANFGIESIFPPVDKAAQRRQVHVVGFGLGALVAHACFNTHGPTWAMDDNGPIKLNPSTVSLFAPLGRRGSAIISPDAWRPVLDAVAPGMCITPLGPNRVARSVLEGYRGEWTDILATVGHHIENASRVKDGRSRQSATLAELLTDRDNLNDMMKLITGKNRLKDWASF